MYSRVLLVMTVILALAGSALAADPWADEVVGYNPGGSALPGYTTPANILGAPTSMTGDPNIWPYDPVADKVAVSMVNGPWTPDDVVSVTSGGFITVKFNEPVVNSPLNPFGIDLIVFGNTSFFSADWPTNQLLMNPAMWSAKPGLIEVSPDGVNFYEISKPGVANTLAAGLFPSHAFATAAGDPAPGTQLQDFLMPLSPGLSLSDFDGLTVADALALYGDSAGGAGIDLDWAVDALGEPIFLGDISYVRLSGDNITFDAMADVPSVPEPTSMAVLMGGAALMALGRLRNRRK